MARRVSYGQCIGFIYFYFTGNNHGSKLTLDGLSSHYDYYKTKYFLKLLDDSNVPHVEKAFIKNMLTKPWNLYVFRHSALTEKSQILSVSVLKDHAGWNMSSKMAFMDKMKER